MRSGTNVPYLSCTRSLTTGNGHSIPSTVRGRSCSLTFMGKRGQYLADRVVPRRRKVEDRLGSFFGSQQDSAQISGVLVSLLNWNNDWSLGRVQDVDGPAAVVELQLEFLFQLALVFLLPATSLLPYALNILDQLRRSRQVAEANPKGFGLCRGACGRRRNSRRD